MAFTVQMVTFDCVDPSALAHWWATQFGGAVHPLMPDEYFVVTMAEGADLGFQKVDVPTPGKNRLHLDFHIDGDIDVEVARLTAAGAHEVERHAFGDQARWVVLRDPEGNVFCVAGG
ncbi:MAG: VOC family protein [Mycolicibacterium insubricum]